MNLDSLVAIAGLIAAVYAILPRTRRLELSLRFGFLGWIIIGVGFFTVIYLQFYQTFRIFGLTPGLNLARWGITPTNASFLVVFFTSLALFVYISLRSLSRSNVVKFRELVLELSREKRYPELFYLVQKYIDQIKKIYSADFWLARLKRYFERNSNERLLMLTYSELSDDEERERKLGQLTGRFRSRIVRPIYRRFSSILPGYEKEREISKEIIHELLLNEKTVQAIASTRPYFALLILEQNFYENQEFIEIYLRSLTNDTKSVLYLEIKNNQNLKSHDEYDLPERNRLLHYLFFDSGIAKKYAVYRPIGEFVISELDRLYTSDLPDPHNEPMGDFRELGQWESKVLGGIRFFDIMVTSALYQNIRWHMWLYYFPHFAERIIRNLDPNEKLVDPWAEWPTKYHYCLYEIVSTLCKWIAAVEHLPAEQENIILKNTSTTHENGNIPKSSMLALGTILKNLLTSDNIEFRYKQYIMDIVYRCYFDIRPNQKCQDYARALINAVLEGGFGLYSNSAEYLGALLDTFEEFDRIPYSFELSNELKALLEEKINEKET